MTAYALVIRSYTQEGSALQTALLMLFLATISLVAGMYNAAFPAMMLSKAQEKAAEPHSCLLYCGLQVLLYV